MSRMRLNFSRMDISIFIENKIYFDKMYSILLALHIICKKRPTTFEPFFYLYFLGISIFAY